MTNRYSDRILAEGESYEDSPERAQASLAEALAVLRETRDAMYHMRKGHHLHCKLPASGKNADGSINVVSCAFDEQSSKLIAKADALLARGGK